MLPPNMLLTCFGTMATQVRRLNPEVSLVTFLPVHLLKQNILLLPLVVISLHIHRYLKEQIHTKIAREPMRRPVQSTLTLSQTLTSCPPPLVWHLHLSTRYHHLEVTAPSQYG